LKVLSVTSSFPRYEGDYYGNFVHAQCLRLAEAGVDITVLAPRTRSSSQGSGKLKIVRFPFMPSKRLETLPEQTLKHASPIELMQLPPYLCSAYLHLVEQPTDIVHAHLAIPMGFLASFSPRKAPLVVTCHGGDCLLPLEKPAYRPFVKRALRKADRVVTVSEFIKNLARRLGAPEERVEVIYLGVDSGRFRPASDRDALREALGIPTDKLVVGTLRRLVPEKRVEDFIRAAVRIQGEVDSFFVVGGEGIHRPYLERLSRELGLANMMFLGRVADASLFHRLCDVFVLTSVGEGLSISLQEAMATGCVPVAVDGFGCPEVITDGVNGYLFKPRDVEGLTEKVLQAASNLRLGRKARETIVRRFSQDEGVRRYLDLYRELSPGP
jgi:glycosyltransferase involved in cell wall biosynthesis